MKKLLIALLTLSVVGAVFAADPVVTVTGGGRMFYNIAQDDGVDPDDLLVSTGPGWQRAGATVKGTSDNAGFQLDVFATGFGLDTAEDFVVGDQAKLWITFSPMATLSAGKIQGNTLRGKLGGGWWTSFGLEDDIFARFYPKKGLLLDLVPVEGVYVGVALDTDKTGTTTDLLEDQYKAIQVGAGYTIKDVGLVRAQYIGSADDTKSKIQAAFAYTGMAGLTADFGFTYFIDGDAVDPMKLAGGAKYAKDAIGGALRFKSTFGNDTDADVSVAVDFTYMVDKVITAGIEAQYVDALSDTTTAFSATPFVKLGFAKGEFRAGFSFTAGLDSEVNAWAIPVGVGIGF